MAELNNTTVDNVGQILVDKNTPLPERFRALFTLRNLGGGNAIDYISKCFNDDSCLLKHECAYCLGQMEDAYAISTLTEVLVDKSEDAMVRHEAGEALGAIGSLSSLELLQQYSSDPVIEVAETCQLAAARIQWLHSTEKDEENLPGNPYLSVDPAPPCQGQDVDVLRTTLLDEQLPLFKRYRAMFALRNLGTTEAVLALSQGLRCTSALFRHEVAYVLGQMQDEAGVAALKENLQQSHENYMVRHECAEALGSIANKECIDILEEYLTDPERVVKESCEVALDICDHEISGQFQYADGLDRVNVKELKEKTGPE